MMVDRTGMMSTTGMGTPMAAAGMPATSNCMMVPRCTIKMEKCTGGMKITCTCDDKMACSMMQNLCTMLAGGMCSLLHDDERHDGLLLQPDDGHVQVRDDRQGLRHHLHQRRQEVLRDDPGLLRLPDTHDQGRLHLLRDDEQHPRLLRLLLSSRAGQRNINGVVSFFVQKMKRRHLCFMESYRIHAEATVYSFTYSIVERLLEFVSQKTCAIVTDGLDFRHRQKHLQKSNAEIKRDASISREHQ